LHKVRFVLGFGSEFPDDSVGDYGDVFTDFRQVEVSLCQDEVCLGDFRLDCAHEERSGHQQIRHLREPLVGVCREGSRLKAINFDIHRSTLLGKCVSGKSCKCRDGLQKSDWSAVRELR
jgi:hypothetical protein